MQRSLAKVSAHQLDASQSSPVSIATAPTQSYLLLRSQEDGEGPQPLKDATRAVFFFFFTTRNAGLIWPVLTSSQEKLEPGFLHETFQFLNIGNQFKKILKTADQTKHSYKLSLPCL